MGITHQFVSGKADGADATLVQPGDWNADHTGAEYSVTFSKQGTLATSTGALRWYNRSSGTLTFTAVELAVGTPPTTQSIIVDVNKVGTTIFATQANRPSIAATDYSGYTTTFDTTTISIGQFLTVDIDQIGTGTVGSDLTVTIWMRG